MSKVTTAIVATLTAAFCVSCTETAPPETNAGQITPVLDAPTITSSPGATATARQTLPSQRSTTAPTPRTTTPRTETAAAQQDAPMTIPKGAQYTIQCYSIKRAGHVGESKQLKDALVKSTGWNGWYLVHQECESILYFGQYRTFNDPADPQEATRAQMDRRRVSEWEDQRLSKPFKQAMFVNLDAPDPDSPPEWNLLNAKGFWSVQIAAYRNGADRKRLAVDSVRSARAQGFDAYYYHGDSISSVCIGAWPETAVKRQEAPQDYNPVSQSERDIIVLPPGMNPSKMNQVKLDNPDIKVLSTKVEFNDDTLVSTMKLFPIHAVNGVDEYVVIKDPATGQKVRKPVRPMLVPIPERTTSVLSGGDGSTAAPPPVELLQRRPRSMNGTLRGIGP